MPAIFLPFFFASLSAERPRVCTECARNAIHQQGGKMIRSRSYAVEIAAQVVLAAAIGLFVSIALAGATMLLAA
jgi:hypothetical protein